MTYSATYDELIATGNLRVIRDPVLRQTIVEHFRVALELVEELEDLPLGYNARIKALTGTAPARYVSGAAVMSPEVRARLIGELPGDEQALLDLRQFQAELMGAPSSSGHLSRSMTC